MNNNYAVIVEHYIILNEQERINLINMKGEIISESDDRIDLKIDGNIYDLPNSIIKKINKLI